MKSYKITEIPEQYYLSPNALLDWWGQVELTYGHSVALERNDAEFKYARELWIASVFALCKRFQKRLQGVHKDYWIKHINDQDPDTEVIHINDGSKGYEVHKELLEITEKEYHSKSLESVLLAKLKKSYNANTQIICYLGDTKNSSVELDIDELTHFVSRNNPKNYTVWLLGALDTGDPEEIVMGLVCLTHDECIKIDYRKELEHKNSADCKVLTGRGTSKEKIYTKNNFTIKLPAPLIKHI